MSMSSCFPTPPLSEAVKNGASSEWFCVRTQPKHEHIAARHLSQLLHVDVFHPRLRYVRATRRGPVSTTESLFPNYLFARFNWQSCLNLVQYSSGVSEVVHFGNNWPSIPDDLINELRAHFGNETIRTIPPAPEVGETILVSNGIFEGLEAVVTRVMPGAQRVAVLLDFLGRQSSVELRTTDIVRNARGDAIKGLNLVM
jgi:transcriptional antiterminator RfaH